MAIDNGKTRRFLSVAFCLEIMVLSILFSEHPAVKGTKQYVNSKKATSRTLIFLYGRGVHLPYKFGLYGKQFENPYLYMYR